VESPSDPYHEEILQEEMAAQRKSRAMVELLRRRISGDLNE
jgi:hypothetical protein